MSPTCTTDTPARRLTGRHRWRPLLARWPSWTTTAAQAVMAGYAVALSLDLAGGPTVLGPSTNPDNLFRQHWLADRAPDAVAWGGLALAGVGLLVLQAQRRRARRARTAVTVVGYALAGFLALALPGNLSLDTVPGLNLLNLKRFAWPTFHLTVLCYTGLAVAASTLAHARATAGACPHCGRRSGPAGDTHPRWRRAGVAVTVVAALAPCGYASSRLLWAAGIPVGTTEEFLERINANNPGNGTVVLELTMATMALAGALLTLGLLRPWGRVWPRWVPGRGGRAVPHALPVTAGTLAGVGLTGLGMFLWPMLLRFAGGETVYFPETTIATTWLSHVPGLSLAMWGPLVLVATAAFHHRTRGACGRCGRG